jgi:hypothetical protein
VIALPTVLGIGTVLFGILAPAPGNRFGEPALNTDTPTEEKEVAEAARGLGVSGGQLIVRHVLPNALSPVIVTDTLGGGSAILAESSLSLLRPGLPPGIPTWGQLLADTHDYPEDRAPSRAVPEGSDRSGGDLQQCHRRWPARCARPAAHVVKGTRESPATSHARQASRGVMDNVSPDPQQGASSTNRAFTA